MKTRIRWLTAGLLLLPIGGALAERASEADAPAIGVPEQLQQLVTVGDKVAASIAGARDQLSEAVRTARRAQDLLLATCLQDKLTTIEKLQQKVDSPLSDLHAAKDSSEARTPFVVLTVVGQKAAMTLHEANACVDSGNEQPFASVDEITPPAPPDTTDFLPGTDLDGLPTLTPIEIPPFPSGPNDQITDLDPSTDLPMDNTPPDEPPPASPIQ